MEISQYFYRNVVFSKRGDQVALADISDPSAIGEPLDGWLGLILQLADGQHTVGELIPFMARMYPEGVPDNMEDTILSAVERLNFMQFIVLTKKPVELPYYLSAPIEELDIEKARKLVAEDQQKRD